MPKPPRTTNDPFGKKLLAVMSVKGLDQDFAALARIFGVKPGSVYDWVDHGRISKQRYPALRRWSGLSLDWWFDESASVAKLNKVEHANLGDWPFKTVSLEEVRNLAPRHARRIEKMVREALDGWLEDAAVAAAEKRGATPPALRRGSSRSRA
jgi:hypothetical protein